MNDSGFPFLTELGAQFRRAARQQAGGTAHRRQPDRKCGLAGVPVLAALGVAAYLLLAGGSSVVPKVPVVDFSAQALAATLPAPSPGTKVIGSPACLNMFHGGSRRPPIHSAAAPDPALLGELSLLRRPSAPLDRSSLGKWDSQQRWIRTVFARYIRVVDGPRHARLAFLPVTYCNVSPLAPPNPIAPGGVVRATLEQALVMLVLSNPGDHPPMLVGTAQQIKRGPGLAGTDTDAKQGHYQAWVEATVVPDGVRRVVMKFSPGRHDDSNSVPVHSNVGIVVRRPPYSPTTVLWYGAGGRLIKKFVDHRALAEEHCQTAHRRLCRERSAGSGQGVGAASYQLASNDLQTGPPALLAQANALYHPVDVFHHSVTGAETARARRVNARVNRQTIACDAHYIHQIFRGKPGSENAQLYWLWSDVSLLQAYQTDMSTIAPQLRILASAWKSLSLRNPALNDFAHGTAAELQATLNAPPINVCAFDRAVADHHSSYTWARSSSYGVEASTWQKQIFQDRNQGRTFRRYIYPPTLYAHSSRVARPGGPGWRLFTDKQKRALANLPGELG